MSWVPVWSVTEEKHCATELCLGVYSHHARCQEGLLKDGWYHRRTVKQLLDSIEVARSGDFDESAPAARPSRASSVSSQPGSAAAAAPPQPASDSSQRRAFSFSNPGTAPMRAGAAGAAAAAAGRASGIAAPVASSNGNASGDCSTSSLPSWIGAPPSAGAPAAPPLAGGKQSTRAGPGGQPPLEPPGAFLAAGNVTGGSGGLEGWASRGTPSFSSAGPSGRTSQGGGASSSAFTPLGDPLDWMGPGSNAGEDSLPLP